MTGHPTDPSAEGFGEDARIDYDPLAHEPVDTYRMLTASVVPRPVAWVSTISADGVPNLAPYSFFSVASTAPPILQFTSVGRKDSWANISETGEFVINIGAEHHVDAMNTCSIPYPGEVDEFERAGLVAEPSSVVSVPRVAGAPLAFECRKHMLIEIGNCVVIMGRVLSISVRADVLAPDGRPDFDAMSPPSRLGRDEWGLRPTVVDRPRPSRSGPAAK